MFGIFIGWFDLVVMEIGVVIMIESNVVRLILAVVDVAAIMSRNEVS